MKVGLGYAYSKVEKCNKLFFWKEVRFSILTVSTASRGEPHVRVFGMVSNHRVLVMYIVVVIPGPCTLHLEVLESRHPEKAQKLGCIRRVSSVQKWSFRQRNRLFSMINFRQNFAWDCRKSLEILDLFIEMMTWMMTWSNKTRSPCIAKN